jgi:dihydroorotate dehydrogenase (NAD+) catalytic subunit
MTDRLKVDFLGKTLDNPLVLASGVMGVSYSGMNNAVKNGAGMVTAKSFTLEPRPGHNGPVIAEYEAGMINSMGLCNPGIEEGLKEVEQFKTVTDTPLILSVFGTNAEEFLKLTEYSNQSRADFLELNLSCPNVSDEYGVPLSASKGLVGDVISKVKQKSNLPIIAKMSPNTYNVREICLEAERAGADALVLINTLGPGMMIDINAGKPVIKDKFGGISGTAVRPIAVKMVYEVSKAVKIPIIGTGGVVKGNDVIEMVMAGARLIGIGTAVYYRGIEVFNKIKRETLKLLDELGHKSIRDIKPID